MNQTTLIDTSFLYAVYNQKDKNHASAMKFMDTTDTIPLVPVVALPEVTFLFLRDVGYDAVLRFLGRFSSSGLKLQQIKLSDIQLAQQIMSAYPKAEFDLVDACIMALSERLDITKICTFDRRDFSIFRPKHCDYLELLP